MKIIGKSLSFFLVSWLTLYSIDTHFDTSTTVFENIAGKGEIARDEQFLLFPRFLLNQTIVSPFVHIFAIISLFAAVSEEPKIGISGKGLSSRSLTFNKVAGALYPLPLNLEL